MREKYVKQIVKALRCSKAKREDIKKQLTADIVTAQEQGESEEEIMARMGTAKEIASEFNASFPEEEVRKYKKEKTLKTIAIIVAVVVLLGIGLYWIVPKYTSIEGSTVFREEQLIVQTQEVIDLLNAEEYEALQAMATEQLKPMLTAEYLEPVKEQYFGNDWGAFKNLGNPYIMQIKQMNVTNAVVQVNASYENISVTYTLLFDEEGKLTGMYMK